MYVRMYVCMYMYIYIYMYSCMTLNTLYLGNYGSLDFGRAGSFHSMQGFFVSRVVIPSP